MSKFLNALFVFLLTLCVQIIAPTATVAQSSGPYEVSIGVPRHVTSDAPLVAQIGFTDAVSGYRQRVSGFDISDIRVEGATLSGFVENAARTTYDVTVTPDGSRRNITLTVPFNAITDARGNTERTDWIAYAGSDAPVVEITSAPQALASTDRLPIEFTISKSVTSGHQSLLSKFQVTNGSMVSIGSVDFLGYVNGGPKARYRTYVEPATLGDVTISMPAGVIQDFAGNGNLAMAPVTIRHDTTRATITLSGPPKISADAQGTVVTALFSHAPRIHHVEGPVRLAQIEVVNGTIIGNMVVNPSNNREFTFRVRANPNPIGDVTVRIPAGVSVGFNGRNNLASNLLGMVVDADRPVARITDTPASISTLDPFYALVAFSEPVEGFDASDVLIEEATIDRMIPSGDGMRFLFVLRPTGNGHVALLVPDDAARDVAGNSSVSSGVTQINFLREDPKVSFTGVPTVLSTLDPIQVGVNFSEPVTGFAIDDIVISNGRADRITGSGAAYTLTLVPTAPGPVEFWVRHRAAQSAGGYDSAPSPRQLIAYDTPGAPQPVLSGAPGSVNSTQTFFLTVAFNETVQGFEASDLQVTNAAVTGFSGDGRSFQVNVTPDMQGDITLHVPAGVAQDAGGTASLASALVVVPVDQPGHPTVVLSGAPVTRSNNDPFVVTARFSEAVTGFDASDMAVTNATVDNVTGGPSTYTLRVTPTANGVVTVQVPSGAVLDTTGHDNLSSNIVSVSFAQATQPTVTLSAPAAVQGLQPYDVTAEFSEVVTGFDGTDVAVMNGSVTGFSGSGTRYVVSVTPDGGGAIEVGVPANVAVSGTAVGNLAATPVRTNWSAAPTPTVTLSGAPSLAVGLAPFTVRAEFSEPVAGFDMTDPTATNASVRVTQTGFTSFDITVTPDGRGDIDLQVPPGVASSLAGMWNQGSNAVRIPWASNASRPTVVLSGAPGSVSTRTPFTVTATFSDDLMGFDATDLQVSNALAVLTGSSGRSFTITVTPSGTGDIALQVRQDAASKPGGPGNVASNIVVVTWVNTAPISKDIAEYMQRRANDLASNQPDILRFLRGRGGHRFNASVTRNRAVWAGQFTHGAFWGEITGAWSPDTTYVLGTLGAHVVRRDNLVVGAMVQMDHADDSARRISGEGWLVGPYFVARLPDQPLYFEGRLLFGRSDNDITLPSGHTDRFLTDRMLVQLAATGEVVRDRVTWLPRLSISHTSDHQRAYATAGGAVIPAQSYSLTQINAGLGFVLPIAVDHGAMELNGALSAIYSASSGSALVAAGSPQFEGYRGRAELGLSWDLPRRDQGRSNLQVKGFYDGLGSDHESWGAQLDLSLEF